jgi:hypothetical protein
MSGSTLAVRHSRCDTALLLTSFRRSPTPTALTAKRNDSRDVANAERFAPAQPTGCEMRDPGGCSSEEASWL